MKDPLTLGPCEHCKGTGHREYVTPARIEAMAYEAVRNTGRYPRIARMGGKAKAELLGCFSEMRRFPSKPSDTFIHTSLCRVFIVQDPDLGEWEVVVE